MKLPQDFVVKYGQLLGDKSDDFFASFDQPSEKGFRINPLKDNPKKIQYSLKQPVEYTRTGYYGNVSGKSLEHQSGYVYSQDLSAMYVAENVTISADSKILDLCAAPGGKSTQVASLMNNHGLLVSNEINHSRAKILAENVERIGAKNVIILNESPAKLENVFKGYFDQILVDAPCSGEGMFRKDHNATSYWSKDYPQQCALRQKEILASAYQMLAPGGSIIYSTCTFSPEEDEQIIAWMIEQYPTLQIQPVKKYQGMDAGQPDFANGDPNLSKTVRLWPHRFRGDGHFIAKLTNLTDEVETKKTKKKSKKKKQRQTKNLTDEQSKLWEEFARDLTSELRFNERDLRCYGDHLYFYHHEWPDISRLKFMRPGLLLGEFKKKRFEPAYTLALALQPQEFAQTLILSKTEWASYVHGDTVQLHDEISNGWKLLLCDGKPFAFGKVVNKTVKNFFPKGLRFSQ